MPNIKNRVLSAAVLSVPLACMLAVCAAAAGEESLVSQEPVYAPSAVTPSAGTDSDLSSTMPVYQPGDYKTGAEHQMSTSTDAMVSQKPVYKPQSGPSSETAAPSGGELVSETPVYLPDGSTTGPDRQNTQQQTPPRPVSVPDAEQKEGRQAGTQDPGTENAGTKPEKPSRPAVPEQESRASGPAADRPAADRAGGTSGDKAKTAGKPSASGTPSSVNRNWYAVRTAADQNGAVIKEKVTPETERNETAGDANAPANEAQADTMSSGPASTPRTGDTGKAGAWAVTAASAASLLACLFLFGRMDAGKDR